MNVGVDSMQIFKCKTCGKVIMILKNSSCGTVCCGEDMVELTANTTDAAVEKHVPVISVNGGVAEVRVGEVAHPMQEEHYIEWIALETNQASHIVYLKPGEEPVARFALLDGEEVVSAYDYCNLHGLWKKDM